MNNNQTPNHRQQPNREMKNTANGRVPTQKNPTAKPSASRRNGSAAMPSSGRPRRQPPKGSPTQGNPSKGIGGISAQAPKVRRSAPSRVKLTAEQIEINRANRRREKYYIKKHRSAAIRTFVSRLTLFFAIFALMAAISAGLFYMNLTRNDSKFASRYSYAIGDNKYSLSADKSVRNGRVYVNFNDVAELCGLLLTGTAEDMKFISPQSEETIRFIGDSRAVYVNGIEARLGSAAYISGGDIFVPLDFVKAYLKGVTIDHDESSSKVSISRIVTNLDEKGKIPKGEEPIYSELKFLLKSPLGLSPLDEEAEALANAPELGFLGNLEIYEEYMNPGNTDEFLFVVNREHRLTAENVPQDLTALADTRQDGRQTQLMRLNAAMSLEAMFKELRLAGFEDVSVTSAYRSYSYQESIYNGYVASMGQEEADKVSMPAGSSEHQSGLCADLHNLPSADKAFANEPAYEWLKNNCWKFGFILRYPADKTEITSIDFEPWHYRYVGRYHAQKIYEMGLCLEEYIDYLSVGKPSV